MDTVCVFKRIEKKYILTEMQYEDLFRRIGGHIRPDRFGRSMVMSLYLDTPDHRIIRESIEAEDYKQKLRLRSYGVASADTAVYLELKKKYEGVVYKRRISMALTDAVSYLTQGVKPFESQILSEIDWTMQFYRQPAPAMLIACEREAWFDSEHPDLRLTFDRDIRFRETDLRLDRGSAGLSLLEAGEVLLEIKTGGGMPLWLADALDSGGILPRSFSKYGTAYLRTLEKKQPIVRKEVKISQGGEEHVVNL